MKTFERESIEYRKRETRIVKVEDGKLKDLNEKNDVKITENTYRSVQGYNQKHIIETFSSTRDALLEIKHEQITGIQEILKKRKIEYLVHFTRFENINSILKKGLVPVSEQQRQGIIAKRNDPERLDHKPDCTSCSVTTPNHYVLKEFRKKYPDARWAFLIIKSEIILLPSNIVYFCHSNAAHVMNVMEHRKTCTAASFEGMFGEKVEIKCKSRTFCRPPDEESNVTTDKQAELLISGLIEPDYINGIIFECQQDFDDYKHRHGTTLLNNLDYLAALS